MIKNNRYQYDKMKVFPKSAIGGLTKKLNSFRFGRNNTVGDDGNSDLRFFYRNVGLRFVDQEYNCNGEIFHFDTARKITAEQTKFGKQWLKDYYFKSNGQPRSGKRTENVGSRVLGIAKSVSRFEFVGVLGLKNSFGDLIQFVPIYRTYNRKGEYFDYAPIHWGQPVIMEGV